jgi:phosphomannomutase
MNSLSLSAVREEAERRNGIDTYRSHPGILALRPALQHYAWGDPKFIPALLGDKTLEGRPCAELWMGAHPDAPAGTVLGDSLVPLDQLLAVAYEEILHPAVVARFGRQLPFLFKVLTAAAPLSLQTHPNKQNAEEGFARENKAGLSLNAPERNYRDANHKPELLVALTDFYGLRGFRRPPEVGRQIEAVPELREVAPDFQPTVESLRAMYVRLMELPPKKSDALLTSLVERLAEENRRKAFTKADQEFWLLRADHTYSRPGQRDRGLFSFYLLNLVHLRPGEGMYLPAGILHAYLAGAGVELMANSNNVLRGGLTPKHIDVPELLRNITFDGTDAEVLHGRRLAETQEWIYPTPAAEFELSRIELDAACSYKCRPGHSVEILIVLSAPSEKPITVRTATQTRTFERGQAFLVPHGATYELSARGPATLFKAAVPLLAPAGSELSVAQEAPVFRGRKPRALTFGTSGLRGLVTDITDLEAYINARGFLEFLREIGEVSPGQPVSLAGDLRPSSDSPERSIMRAVARAIVDAQSVVDNLGLVPTPALAYYAMQQRRPSIMVTGSHIPFDRNGIKFNKSTGEILKADESPILQAVRRVRSAQYARERHESLFGDDGMFKDQQASSLPRPNSQARRDYLKRYLDFFPGDALQGRRIVFYQHSAVGRDLLVELLTTLGAETIPMGRSENFVPIDTEAISTEQLELLQRLADQACQRHGPIDAVLSTDGDSDRPLLAGIDANGKVRFCGGDLLGIVAAEFLEPDAVVVPISANDAVDRWAAKQGVTVVKTRIGSPYVIAAMDQVRKGGAMRVVVGWEANGGFLVATDIKQKDRTLKALPTRDAALPLLAALCSAKARGVSMAELFATLPRRFSKAGLIDNFPSATSQALLRRFTPADARIEQVEFSDTAIQVRYAGASESARPHSTSELDTIRRDLEKFFSPKDGFDRVLLVNVLDGVRVYFANGDIAHIRPSGNAPQLRVYAVADSQARADAIVARAACDPDSILRQLEAALTSDPVRS